MGTLINEFGDWVCVTLEPAQLKTSILRLVKVTDSWPACHEFESSTSEEPPCRGGRCTLNMSRLNCPPIGVEVRRWGAGSGIVLFTGLWFLITRSIAKRPRVS
ncbi:hypothetical protein TNCV_1212261 [Trichonephila clavipes]|nr:hypothetical protein TNCV_1212261 [Trichonephila clavipes]